MQKVKRCDNHQFRQIVTGHKPKIDGIKTFDQIAALR